MESKTEDTVKDHQKLSETLSKVTLHFVWSQPSRKQTVDRFLRVMLGLCFMLAVKICVSSCVTIMPTIPRMDDKLDLVKMWVQQKILEQQISEKEIQMNSAASEAHNQKSIESKTGDFDVALVERDILPRDPKLALARFEEIYHSSGSPEALLGQAIALKTMAERMLPQQGYRAIYNG